MSKPLDRLATTSPLDRSTGSADRRPVIGITSYGRDEKRRFRVSVDYVDAVRRAGGIPIVLPPGEACQDQLFALLDAPANTGMGLTESFAMTPAAAVSGFYLAHPQARYFAVSRIARDQLEDWAARAGFSVAEAERWLAPLL